MEEYLGFLFLVIILGIITGVIGGWIAKKKGRREGEGFWLGFLLSFIGLIIEGVLPKFAKPDPVPRLSGIDGRVFDASVSDGRSRRKCPFCAEMILAEARVCRYCQRDVPLGEVVQGPSSHILYPSRDGTVYHRQDCPEISIKPMQPIELREIPQGADPCSVCNPPAALVHDAGAQASTSEQQSPAKEHSSLFTSSSSELNSNPPEQVAQSPAPLTCPSCARKISANDSFCFFCGKKLQV
jgi:uncharacterized membrane protein YeaQ/YmgE (transglycosylase-associated protein family)